MMRLKMFLFRACLMAPLVAMLIGVGTLVGCANREQIHADTESEYRTINAGPLRDTAAARQANNKGLTHLDAGEL